MIPAVVIGGERRIVDEDITPRLNKHGLDVIEVFPMDKEMGELPRNAEVFVFLTNMMSHRHNDAAKAEAERRGNVKVVYGSSKGSLLVKRLVESGFPEMKENPSGNAAPRVEDTPTTNAWKGPVDATGGFYAAEILDAYMDDKRVAILIQIQYGPKPHYAGACADYTLLTRKEYEEGNEAHIERVRSFMRSLGVATTDGRFTNADVPLLRNQVIYFQIVPSRGSARLDFFDKSSWMLKSAAQRRRLPYAPNAEVTETPVVETPVVPEATPVSTLPASIYGENPPSSEYVRGDKMFDVLYTSFARWPDKTPTKTLAPYANGTYQRKEEFVGIVRLLAADPTLTTRALLAERNKLADAPRLSENAVSSLARDARIVLGLTYDAGGNIYIDRPIYEHTCKMVGVKPVEGDHLRRACNLVNGTAPKATPAAPKTPAPEPPPAAVTPPVAAFTPANDDLADLREILTMLRDEMAKRDIRRMVVTPEGVDFTRVVTVSGKMEF